MWLWIALGVTALVIVCCGIGALGLSSLKNRSDKAGQGASAGTPTPQPTAAGMGQPVRDGEFEFVVRSVQCGVSQVGSDYLIEKAQGQFCLLTLDVKNVGDEPSTLFDRAQKGFGTNGLEYNANSAAGISANDTDSQVWVTEINPGNEMTGIVVYDLPKDVELAQVELHDLNSSSTGALVDLK